MNKHLKSIHDLLKHNNQLSEQEKEMLLKAIADAEKQWSITEFKLDRTEKVKKTTAILLEETIEELEQKRKAVEEQNRELEIETALEKVRAVAMGMRQPEDMLDVCRIISQQLDLLNVKAIRNVQTAIFNQQKGIYLNYEFFRLHDKKTITEVEYNLQPDVKDFVNQMLNDPEAFFTTAFEGAKLKEWMEYQEKANQFVDPHLYEVKSLHYYFYSIGPGALGVSTYAPLNDNELAVFKRFRNVFELAYRRFIDIQKAEAQAREAKIELALERVRAKTIAMQKPSEFVDVVTVIGEQFVQLGFDNRWANFGANGLNISGGFDVWNFAVIPGGQNFSDRILFPYFDHPLFTKTAAAIENYRTTGNDLFEISLNKKDKDSWLDHLYSKTIFQKLPAELKSLEYDKPGYITSVLVLKDTFLSIGKFDRKSFSNEHHAILRRVGKAFGQAYTRFLDLQKAEAQAREAQIEAGLERVRSRAMAMQTSEELNSLIGTVFTELTKLDLVLTRCVILIYEGDEKGVRWWMANSEAPSLPMNFFVKYADMPFFNEYLEGWHKSILKWQYILEGENKVKTDEFLFNETELSQLPDFVIAGMKAPERVYLNASFNNFGNLTLASLEPLSDEHFDILLRFAKVFDLTYTRFNDLQQAEAQAREAQIELGLERVRARAMAMQKSDELKELIVTVSVELSKLDIVLDRCFIITYDIETMGSTWWMSNPEIPTEPIGLFVKYHEHLPYLAHINAWKERELKWQYILEGEVKKTWDKFLFVETELAQLSPFVIANMRSNEKVYLSSSFNNFGYLTLATLEALSDEQFDIMLRFAKVFDLTYTRFNDLKQAEAQAREAQIQLALERVRARTMAMQKSDELMETAVVLFNQLNRLGENIERTIIGVVNEEEGVVDFWATRPDGSQMDKMQKFPIDEPIVMQKVYGAWRQQKKSIVIDLHGEELDSYFQFLKSRGPKLKRESLGERRVENFVFFSKGMLGVINADPNTPANVGLYERFAAVFDQTYTRFLDLQKAEAQAREAKIEAALEKVRSRTMAMQRSNELAETAYLLFEQLKDLGETPDRAFIALIDEEEHVIELWTTQHGGKQFNMMVKVSVDEPHVMKKFYAGWKQQKKSLIVDLQGEELESYFQHMKKLGVPVDRAIFGERRIDYVGCFSKGVIGIITQEPRPPELLQLLERFAGVFDLTYTRFLDLQKAEAQAKESQIQLALERVRARTMAMQKSEELDQVVSVVFEQLLQLGFPSDGCAITLYNKENLSSEYWMAIPDNALPQSFTIPYFDHQYYKEELAAWQKGMSYQTFIYEGELKKSFELFVLNHIPLANFPNAVKEVLTASERVIASIAFMDYGSFSVIGPEPLSDENASVLQRFTKVFDQTYTRFLDLQKAEAQARQAKIEAAMEKVRSRAMAMQKPNELVEVAELLRKEMGLLGVEELEGSSIFIHHEDIGKTECWYAIKDAQHPEKALVSDYMTIDLNETSVGKKMLEFYQSPKNRISIPMLGQERKEWINFCADHSKVLEGFYGDNIPDRIYHLYKFPNGYMGAASPGDISTESWELLQRATTVFSLAYTRFSDLQQAEAQAREAQIELALERVRATTMAMQRSEELSNVATVLFQQVKALGVSQWVCGFCIWEIGDTESMWYSGSADGEILPPVRFPLTEHPVFRIMDESRKRGDELYIYEKEGEVQADHYRYMMTLPGVRELLQRILDAGRTIPTFQIDHYANFAYGNLIFITYEHFPEMHDIFKRFAKVFEQTYTRFLDLQKAEAQAREATIEAALERVRARTMAMHNSNDVSTATATMFTELEKLGIENFRGGITNIRMDQTQEVWSVNNVDEGKIVRAVGIFNMNIHPFWQSLYKGWEQKEEFLHYYLAGKEKEDYVKILNKTPNYLSQPIKQFPDTNIQAYYYAEGAVWTFSLKPHTEEDKQIMKKFTSVFSLTSRRYQDLKKAEAQAREATIEAALERVRAKAMAMHTSEDLAETIKVFYQQMGLLNLMPRRCGVGLIDEETHTADLTGMIISEHGEANQIAGKLKLAEHPVLKNVYDNWLLQKEYHPVLRGNEIKKYYQFIGSQISFQDYPDDAVQYGYFFFFTEGCVYAWAEKQFSEDELKIYRRFTSVLSLTYKRYMDLKLAESQAREATIEAALEKVRGKSMAMHNSNDLTATASMVFTELRKLGISPIRCGVGILNKKNRKALLYSATASEEEDSLSLVGWVLLDVNPVLKSVYDSWIRGEDYFPVLKKEMLKSYYEHLKSGFEVPDEHAGYEHHGYFLAFSEGMFYGWSEKPFTEAEIKILKRFASVIDLTFRRYIELQKSEANAREAVKQAALDRVRAEIASMRTVADLDKITPLIWSELTILGIPFIRCGVFIMDDSQQLIHTFLSTPEGEAIAAFHLPYDTPGNIAQVLRHWQNKKNYIDHWDESAFTEFADILVEQGGLASAEQYLKTIPHGGFYLHFLPFLQGMLYVGNTAQLDEDEIKLIQSVANAFSTAYARYEDFNKLEVAKKQVDSTLNELQATQKQLIQSEKMASLGELTAGIAHEIQNPLNFVNNFSEVSNELLNEMITELENNNKKDAIAIADDVKQNLEKILHHGKRADGIVKGMLQHSRISSSVKEPTDINKLADEYLRLAYHGLRAKDKSFNATLKTDFDESIGSINVIPQDIGRVLLNLYNNAFYAVIEKNASARSAGQQYEPTVAVSTKALQPLPAGGVWGLEIRVTDNGKGIPKKVLDKIFQPFFTTKPTGQGTGLGLSLSYDIIKAHGGELKVETMEGKGAEFIIQLSLV